MGWDSSRGDMNIYSQGKIDRLVYSTCNLCSNGCGCFIAVKDEKIVGIVGNEQYPVNRGRLGPKGENQWWANNSVDRLTAPLIRHNGKLLPASWEDAYSLLTGKVKEVLEKKGPGGLAMYHTGQAFLEDYYTIAKITRAGLGMHHVDANTRLCTATSEWALIESFGADGPPACEEDIDLTDVIVFIGRNSNETNTVLWERVLSARQRNGTKIIEIDPRSDLSDKMEDLSLQPKSGTNVAILNGLVHLIIKNGWIDRGYIKMHTIGYEQLERTVAKYTPALVEDITGVPKEKLIQCAEWIGRSQKTLTILFQGVYQSMDAIAAGTLVNSMHLFMGKIGKPGSGPFQHAGQSSAMSNREAGGAGFYPGYRNNDNPNHILEIAGLWNVEPERLPVGPQTYIMEIMNLIDQGEIDLFWVMYTNPAVSLPHRTKMVETLKKPFLVVQDPFLSETAELADLVLPSAMWGEKEGTMTNLERRVNVLRKAVDPPFGLPSDFEILLEFSKRMGFKEKSGRPLITYRTPEEAFNEWRRVSAGRPCDMSGMTYEKMERLGGIQWPCNDQYPNGRERLYTDGVFPTHPDYAESYGRQLETGRARTKGEFERLNANGRAILYGFDWSPPVEVPGEEYPFELNTGRNVFQWHTRTKTGRAPMLHLASPEAYAEINPDDAEAMGIEMGDMVMITTKRGVVRVPARITDAVRPKAVFLPFHFGALSGQEAANNLTLETWDQVSKQPHFKNGACKVEKVHEGS